MVPRNKFFSSTGDVRNTVAITTPRGFPPSPWPAPCGCFKKTTHRSQRTPAVNPCCRLPTEYHHPSLVCVIGLGFVRRSKIEVHPNFSESPHLRSSIPHPKTDFSKNYNGSRRIIPWRSKSTERFLVEIKIDIPTIRGQETPPFRKQIAEMCYLYHRTGLA